MSVVPSAVIRFPNARYDPEVRLLNLHPHGVLDDELAVRLLEVVETEELIKDGPFNRYVDFSGITEVHFKAAHVFWVAERRRRNYTGIPVRAAFFADWAATVGIARLYEELMCGSAIEVRVFRNREVAAAWLGVPADRLHVNS